MGPHLHSFVVFTIYYQLLDVLSEVSCVEILYCEYYGCISKFYLFIGNLNI